LRFIRSINRIFINIATLSPPLVFVQRSDRTIPKRRERLCDCYWKSGINIAASWVWFRLLPLFIIIVVHSQSKQWTDTYGEMFITLSGSLHRCGSRKTESTWCVCKEKSAAFGACNYIKWKLLFQALIIFNSIDCFWSEKVFSWVSKKNANLMIEKLTQEVQCFKALLNMFS
jgi:hypothetical protein